MAGSRSSPSNHVEPTMSHPIQYDAIKVGDTLIADGGFTCLADGCRCLVRLDQARSAPNDGLYVECAEGRHFLDGQWEDGVIIGFTAHIPAVIAKLTQEATA
jgi:hypothetical protein